MNKVIIALLAAGFAFSSVSVFAAGTDSQPASPKDKAKKSMDDALKQAPDSTKGQIYDCRSGSSSKHSGFQYPIGCKPASKPASPKDKAKQKAMDDATRPQSEKDRPPDE